MLKEWEKGSAPVAVGGKKNKIHCPSLMVDNTVILIFVVYKTVGQQKIYISE